MINDGTPNGLFDENPVEQPAQAVPGEDNQAEQTPASVPAETPAETPPADTGFVKGKYKSVAELEKGYLELEGYANRTKNQLDQLKTKHEKAGTDPQKDEGYQTLEKRLLELEANAAQTKFEQVVMKTLPEFPGFKIEEHLDDLEKELATYSLEFRKSQPELAFKKAIKAVIVDKDLGTIVQQAREQAPHSEGRSAAGSGPSKPKDDMDSILDAAESTRGI